MYNQKKFFSNQSNRPRPTQNNNQADLPVLTVSQFIDDTRKKIQAFGFYRIRGQLIDPKLINGSHFFASLRDEKDECRIPIKVRDIHQIKFDRSLLSDNAAGTLVEVTGKTDIFKRRGEYYLQPTRIDNIGLGELYANTERLKAQLQKEGLFDPNRKKPLPFLPHTVGLITGKDSKGKDDVIKNVQRRWPGIRFITKEVTVDGTVPTKDMFNAIESLANDRSIDVIVIARGGGDPQGMIMFNDEKLVREIARCTKPIISAIGHETDHHLIDYVADVAASTPTDVARWLVPDYLKEAADIDSAFDALYFHLNHLISDDQHFLKTYGFNSLENFIRHQINNQMLELKQIEQEFISPDLLYNKQHDHVKNMRDRLLNLIVEKVSHEDHYELIAHQLTSVVEQQFILNSNHITNWQEKLTALNPRNILKRGYAYVTNEQQEVIKTVNDVQVNQLMSIQFHDGSVKAVVKEVKKDE